MIILIIKFMKYNNKTKYLFCLFHIKEYIRRHLINVDVALTAVVIHVNKVKLLRVRLRFRIIII